VLAVLNQYVVNNGAQTRPGLGNINPRLYQLAQTARGVFHDITVGNNIIPCKAGTRDCTNGQYGYSAGPGYDHVTGLGSIDVANLFENWSATKPPDPSVVPSVEPSPSISKRRTRTASLAYPSACRKRAVRQPQSPRFPWMLI
jgi:hypothetical protein